MSYLYGVKFKAAEDPLILALREVSSRIMYSDIKISCAKGTVYPSLRYD
jgi:hypothetical protein